MVQIIIGQFARNIASIWAARGQPAHPGGRIDLWAVVTAIFFSERDIKLTHLGRRW